jgi:hypothetical protein
MIGIPWIFQEISYGDPQCGFAKKKEKVLQ